MNLITKTSALAALAALAIASPASAATSATGSSSVTGAPTGQLEATFPSAYSFGAWALGAGGNISSEQIVNVKSNRSWGVKLSSDEATGLMRRWNGTAYVTTPNDRTLANATQWGATSFDGGALTPTYANLSSTQALILGSKPKTGDAGNNVGLKYKQVVSYADDADIASDVYRILVSFDASQGF